MPETGRRYLAPTAQGSGNGLTPTTAASFTARLTHEAALKAAAVADPLLKASGSPANVAIEMCWRSDLGSYNVNVNSFNVLSTHGGVSATRRLRHCSVNASGVEQTASVVYDHDTETTSTTGEGNVAVLIGNDRTPDPRSASDKTHIINVSALTRYATTVPAKTGSSAYSNVSLAPGCSLNPVTGVVTNHGTGAWNAGDNFEGENGGDFIVWDGFKFRNFDYVFGCGAGQGPTTHEFKNIFVENVKNFYRQTDTTANPQGLTFDGIYVRGCGQAVFRIDAGGNHIIRNVDIDSQFIVGEPIACLGQFGVADANGKVGPILIERFHCVNMWDAPDIQGDYLQGDGVTGNRTSKNITLRDGVFDTYGDGGVDCKTFTATTDPAVDIDNVIFRNGKRNMRLWGASEFGDSIFRLTNVSSYWPWGDAHLYLTGGTLTWDNPDGAYAMVDDQLRSTTEPEGISAAIVTGSSEHFVISLNNLTYNRNTDAPAVNADDNTTLYPTQAAATAAGTYQIKITETLETGTAISATSLTTGASGSNLQVYTTASISPSIDTLILAAVENTRVAPTNTVSLSGCGLTWTQVATLLDRLGDKRLTLFRAMGTPTPGAVTITAAGDQNSSAMWSFAEFSNTATGSGGANAVEQAVAAESTFQVTSWTVTLNDFANPNNATYGAITHARQETTTPGAGFTEIHTNSHSNPVNALITEFKTGNDTSVDATWATSGYAMGIGVELEPALVHDIARPGVIPVVGALPAATPQAGDDASVTPGVIATTVAIPLVPQAQTPGIAVIAAIAALPAATVTADVNVTPAVMVLPVALPAAVTDITQDFDLPGGSAVVSTPSIGSASQVLVSAGSASQSVD